MGKVNWHKDRVMLRLRAATEKALAAVAFQVERRTKENIVANDQIDTGFMLNSVYTVTPEDSTYGKAQSRAENQKLKKHRGARRNRARRWTDVTGRMAPEVTLPESDEPVAAVVVGAKYAIYQETKQSFLYQALLQVAQQAGGIIQAVARSEMHD